MFHSALFGLSIAVLADLLPVGSGTRVDVATGARAELNAGRVPVNSINDSEPGTEERLALRTGVRLVSATSSLRLVYAPQYYLRIPDALDVGRPLLLHDGSLAWNSQVNRRLRLSWLARASAGELPTSGILEVFDPGTGTVRASILPIVRLNTTFSLNAVTGKRHVTNAVVSASHNDSLGSGQAMPTSDNLGLQLSHAISISQRTSTGITGQVGYVAREGQSESAIFGGQLFLSQRLRPQATLGVGVGFSQGMALGGELSWPLPTVDLSYRTAFKATGQSWSLNLSGGTRAFFDVASANYRPQVFVATSVGGRIHDTWTVAGTLSASADVSQASANIGPDGEIYSVQPTQFNFNLPVTYALAETLRLSFGLRLALRGPPVWDWTSGAFQDQVSLFVALDWRLGNEQTHGGWL